MIKHESGIVKADITENKATGKNQRLNILPTVSIIFGLPSFGFLLLIFRFPYVIIS